MRKRRWVLGIIVSLVSLVFVGIWQRGLISLHPFSLDFDSQNISTWKWSATQQVLPIRDVFYPYGLLFYYQHTSVLAGGMIFLLTVISTATVLVSLWRFKLSQPSALMTMVLFLFFLVRSVGIETWSRYGLGVAWALLLPDVIRHKRWWMFVVMGVMVGGLFGLVPDQSVYMAVLLGFGLVVQGIAREGKSVLATIKSIVFPTSSFVFGALVGVVPFVVYLCVTQSYASFLEQRAYMQEMLLFAKAPFIPYALSPSNSFIFLIVFSVIGYLSHSVIIHRKKISHRHMVLALLGGLIILLEQKSIIRSIDWQIVVIAMIIFFLTWERICLFVLRAKTVCQVLALLSTAIFILVFPFKQVLPTTRTSSSVLQSYTNVLERLEVYPDYTGKVFSFPGDPVFYQLTGQHPPYFFTAYESTPVQAQRRIIRYLEDEDIRYVLYNLNISAIQDGVPHYARNSHELSYLLTHYQAIAVIDNFLILKRVSQANMKRLCLLVPTHDVCTWQSSIDLQSIPALANSYEKDLITEIFDTSDQLNTFLEQENMQSHGKRLVFSLRNVTPQTRSLTIFTEGAMQTIVHFHACSRCSIALNMIPLLYEQHRIQRIEFDGDDITEISIIDPMN